jgi:hypothetical protein
VHEGEELLVHTVALAQHPMPDALWTKLATVTSTTDDPEAGRWT